MCKHLNVRLLGLIIIVFILYMSGSSADFGSFQNQALPRGMTKLISSANSPHSALLVWNTTTHVAITMLHISAPIADRITSGEYVQC